MRKVRITTIDNPYDPQEEFNQWFTYDVTNGYNTCAYLSRISKTSDQLSDVENEEENERAIDEILKYDFQNIYMKVTVN
ncbi:MAG TPA: hypothetical protein VFC79_13380 [Tissierellaceae bacterium]|nr:hypothetical protein [Tissierellaceae bacterium]